MNHEHLEDIHSTQDYLRELDVDSESVLISCEHQSNGRGQYDRKWDSDAGSLCLSFTLAPNEVLTLTSLEVGYLIAKFFSVQYQIDLKLKWPNDILTPSAEKVAGVILNNTNSKTLLVGVGINYFERLNAQEYTTPYGFIFDRKFSLSKKEESRKLYEFILANRLNPKDVIKLWNERCIHLNKNITFQEKDASFVGKFLGIGEFGEALIQTPQRSSKYYSGSIIL